MKYYTQKDYARSRTILRKLVRAEPKNPLFWFNLGNANFMLGDFKNAERSFMQVERLRSPLALPARLYRAKALQKRGEALLARRLLQSLLTQPALPPALRDQVTREMLSLQGAGMLSVAEQEALELYQRGRYRRALRLIRRQKRPSEELLLLKSMVLIKLNREDEAHALLRKLENSGRVEDLKGLVTTLLAGIRDTYSKPKWLFIEAAAGADSNVRQSTSSESGGILLTDFGVGGRLWTADLWHLSGGYIGRLHEVFAKTDLRVLVHELQSSFGREVGTDLVLFTPFVQHEGLGESGGLVNAGLRARLRTGDERWEAGLDTEALRHSAIDGEFSHLSGSAIRGRLYAGVISYPVYGQAFVDGERQWLGDPTYSNKSWAPGFRILWKLNSDWAAQISASYRTREYADDKESEMDMNGRLTRFFSMQLSGYLLLDQLRGENFKQTQVLVGIVWDRF